MAKSAINTPANVLRLVPKSGNSSILFDMIRDYTAALAFERVARSDYEGVARKPGRKSIVHDDRFRDAMRRLDKAKDAKLSKARVLFDYIEETF